MARPSIEDRLAIEDLYADYVWALDSGDLRGFLALFTDDAVFGDTAGNRYRGHTAIGEYVTKLVNSAPFRGRQHNLSGMRFEQTGDRIGVKAFDREQKERLPGLRRQGLQAAHAIGLFGFEVREGIRVHGVPDFQEDLVERDFRLDIRRKHRRIIHQRFEKGHDVGITALLRAG